MSLPVLSKNLVCSEPRSIPHDVSLPDPDAFGHPERILQFGTGALLRGFVDAFIAKAHQQGVFDGRVVAVSQTGSGRGRTLNAQDGCYTLLEQGLDDGTPTEHISVVATVSRALSAQDDWEAVLALARSEELRLVVSNTTEVGIRWDDEDDPTATPPHSFPAKLAACLYVRANTFNYAQDAGLVVLPCELIEDNGDALRRLVLRWAARAGWDKAFARWVRTACTFPNTLVDRIVPGTPNPERLRTLQTALGYEDALLTTSELYRLWAIEADEDLAARIGFTAADAGEPGIVLTPDIRPYRLRKVRILNGAHSLTVPLALGCELTTVQETVDDEAVGAFLRHLVFSEIVPTVAKEPRMAPGSAERFADAVLERFANPFIRHELQSITLQQTMKLSVRATPTIVQYAAQHGAPPKAAALGMAAYLLMQRTASGRDGRAGPFVRMPPPLRDDRAEAVREAWRALEHTDDDALHTFTASVLGQQALWTANLAAVPGFAEAVVRHLARALQHGLPAALDAFLATVDV